MSYSIRVLALVLLLGSGAPLFAQAQDTSPEKSMVQVMGPNVANRNESCRALLISDKGLVLTTWRNVCLQGTYSCSANGLSGTSKVVGVHPSRDLALLQVELPKNNPQAQYGPKPAKLATAPLSLGDKIYLYQHTTPTPGIVSSETQPVGNPEYFWISGQDPSSGKPFPGGWGSNQPRPDLWITNLKGEIQGVVARVIVNGKMSLRVIPVHDIRPEDFVPPAQKQPNAPKAEELIRIADGLQKEREKGRYRPVPFGTYEADSMDYLRLALAEDPANKDINFRLGVLRDDSKPEAGPAARTLPDSSKVKSADDADTEFIRSRVNNALEHFKAGRTALGQSILKDVVDTYPKHPEAKSARDLLERLQPPK